MALHVSEYVEPFNEKKNKDYSKEFVHLVGLRRQSTKKPNFWNSEPVSERSTLAMVALCSGDF